MADFLRSKCHLGLFHRRNNTKIALHPLSVVIVNVIVNHLDKLRPGIKTFAITGGAFFAEIQREGFAAPCGGGKRVDTCGFYPLNSRFPLFLNLAQTIDRRPLRKGERQRIFTTVGADQCVRPFLYLYAMPDFFLLHIRFYLRRRDIPVSRNSLVWRLRTAPANIPLCVRFTL